MPAADDVLDALDAPEAVSAGYHRMDYYPLVIFLFLLLDFQLNLLAYLTVYSTSDLTCEVA